MCLARMCVRLCQEGVHNPCFVVLLHSPRMRLHCLTATLLKHAHLCSCLGAAAGESRSQYTTAEFTVLAAHYTRFKPCISLDAMCNPT
jgi:hypothetical protein